MICVGYWENEIKQKKNKNNIEKKVEREEKCLDLH